MNLKPGSRWQSALSDTEVAVVRPPKAPATLACGGTPMLALGTTRPGAQGIEAPAGATLLGKRYSDAPSGLEVLCTKAGAGLLSVDGREMLLKEAKALPSSD